MSAEPTPWTGIPWRRILIEGGVIVVSILLAFGIDALWEGRKEQAELRSLVELLRTDVERNIADLETARQEAGRAAEGMRVLLSILGGGAAWPSQDSLSSLIVATAQGGHFKPTSAAYDAALGTDAWRRVPPDIKVELARFVNDARQNEETIITQSYIELTRIMSRHGGLWSFMPASVTSELGVEVQSGAPDFEGLLADRDFHAWVTLHFVAEYNLERRFDAWLEQLSGIDRALAVF